VQLTFGLLLLLLTAVLQCTALASLLTGPRPDLVLLVVLAWSIVRGLTEGAIFGILGGLALDIMSAGPFGLFTMLLGAIGSLAAVGEANLFRGSLPFYIVSAALVTMVYYVGVALGLQASGLETYGFARFVQHVVPGSLWNALMMPFVFVLVRRGIRMLGGWRQLEL
jgi:rod shape-determining protein MreD